MPGVIEDGRGTVGAEDMFALIERSGTAVGFCERTDTETCGGPVEVALPEAEPGAGVVDAGVAEAVRDAEEEAAWRATRSRL